MPHIAAPEWECTGEGAQIITDQQTAFLKHLSSGANLNNYSLDRDRGAETTTEVPNCPLSLKPTYSLGVTAFFNRLSLHAQHPCSLWNGGHKEST